MTFAYFDGDNIGKTLEVLLTENKILEAQSLSESIKLAMNEIKEYVQSLPNVKTIICGGDDLLIEHSHSYTNSKLYDHIMHIFEMRTKHTMSCGTGNSASEATRQLYLAKLYGKNRIFIGD